MADEPGSRVRSLRAAVVAMVAALALWELGAMDYAREHGRAAEWYTPLGRALVMFGGLAGGAVLGIGPGMRSEGSRRRYLRWVVVMLLMLLPSAMLDFVREPSLSTVLWALLISVGLALTVWFIERRFMSHFHG